MATWQLGIGVVVQTDAAGAIQRLRRRLRRRQRLQDVAGLRLTQLRRVLR